MRLLIVGNEVRNYHLLDFSNELRKKDIETKVIIDTKFLEKTMSFNLKNRSNKKKELKKIIHEFKPEFILLDRITNIARIFLDENIPILVLLRGNYWEEVLWAKKTSGSLIHRTSIYKNQNLMNQIFSNAKLVFPISQYLKNEFLKKYPEKNAEVLYADGRNLPKWKNNSKNILNHPCVGLVQGLNIWGKTNELNTLDNVMEKLPNVTFYLAGDGEYRDKIIPKLSKHKNFIWLGNLDYPNKIVEFLSEIDIFLLLSGLEGLGQSVIEAMIMKKPVIVSNSGGLPEIIEDGINGYLVEVGDHEKIIFLINEILTKPEITKKIIENVENDIEKFSWENICSEFLNIMKKYNY